MNQIRACCCLRGLREFSARQKPQTQMEPLEIPQIAKKGSNPDISINQANQGARLQGREGLLAALGRTSMLNSIYI